MTGRRSSIRRSTITEVRARFALWSAACILPVGLALGPAGLAGAREGEVPTAPPRIVLKARSAAEDPYVLKRGSYCSVDGCLDTRFPRTRRTFEVCPGAKVLIRVRSLARRVKVERLADGLPTAFARARVIRPSNGRRWRFRVPNDSPHRVTLLVTAKYKRQTPYRDAGFGGRLATTCP